MMSGRVRLLTAKHNHLAKYVATLCLAECQQPCHSLRASLAAGLITQKVGVSINERAYAL